MLANWLQRVGAYLIDQLVVLIPAVLGGVVLALVVYNNPTGPWILITVLVYLLIIGVAVAATIYNRWVRQGRTGRSWGKQALDLTLLGMETRQPIGVGLAFLRDVAHVLDGLAWGLGYLWPLWDRRRQTFADMLLKTIVVAEEPGQQDLRQLP